MSGKIRKRPEPPEFVMRRIEGVPLTFLNDAGEQVKEDFAIEFKSFTSYGFLTLNEKLEGQTFYGEDHLECAVLAHSIIAVIDSDGQPLTEESGEPAELTASFFAGLLDEDREAIQAAIKADANPRKPSPASGGSGSSQATASEG
jgi:hypothetical protein